MQNSSSTVDKRSNEASYEENIHGYIPRKCDFKCYKCRYRGTCIISRRLTEARKPFTRNMLENTFLNNNKYRLNDLPTTLGYKKRLLRHLISLKKKIYKDSEQTQKRNFAHP